MQCIECDGTSATLVAVEYTDGRSEQIALCTDCQDVYEEGGFVKTTSPVQR